MDQCSDFSGVKDRVLVELGKTIKLIQCYAVCGFDDVAILGNDSWLVQSLSHSLDLALRHGLRDPHRGYWTLVREFTHSNTLQTIISLKTVHSPLGKGRAWLYFTLTEGSFSSYLQCLSRDNRLLHTYYVAHALMRDTARLEQLITLLAGLEQVHFNLEADVSYLDMSTYSHQDLSDSPEIPAFPNGSSTVNSSFHSALNSTMTSSITSSLASPVDSGVALLDSDADATSVSEATFNGGDNLSLREDDSALTDLDDVKLNLTSPVQLAHKEPPMNDTASETSIDIYLGTLVTAPSRDCVEDGPRCDTQEAMTKTPIQKPLLIEAVLLHTQDETCGVADTTIVKSANDMEKALLHDAGSHFMRKAMFHDAISFKTSHSSSEDMSEEDMPKITVTNAQISEDSPENSKSLKGCNSSSLLLCETEAALEVYEVCPVMTASDIANQNVDPINTNALIHRCMPSIGLGKNVGNFKSDSAYGRVQMDKDSMFKQIEISDQENKSMTKPSTDCEEIVFRRQRKKRNKSEVKVKRVSFHEDLIVNTTEESGPVKKLPDGSIDSCKRNENSSDFSASFLPPNPIIKKDVIRGRYSWCAEGDAPYVSQRSSNPNTRSDVFLMSSNSQSTIDQTHITPHFDKGLISSTPYSNHRCRHFNQDIDINTTPGLRNHSFCCDSDHNKYQSSAESIARGEPHLKSFHDRFSSHHDPVSFEDGNGKMLQMDALIQSAPQSDFKKSMSSLRSVPVTERGTPEGQEDPQRSGSTQHLCPSAAQNYSFPSNLKKIPSVASSIDCFSDLESLRSDLDDRYKLTRNNLIYGSYNKLSQLERYNARRHANVRECKTSLLNRFLKSVTIKKFVEKKARIVNPTRSMYIKGVKFDSDVNKEFNGNIDSEIRLGQMQLPSSCESNVPVDSNLEMIFKTQIFISENEHVYKVFRVRSCYFVGEVTTALLVLLTDANVYVTGVKMNHAYCNHLVLPYTNLDSVLVGPHSQSVMLVSVDGDIQFTIATGDAEMTHQLVSRIELVMRSSRLSPPAIRFLELEDMKALKHSINKPAGMVEEDLLHHYSLIHLQDDQRSPTSTPLGPTIEGHLMFRPATHAPLQPWAPAYCVLKAGVLYMFSDPDHRLPKRVLMLRNGHCKGCLRLKDRRPHTFAILLKGSGARSLQFAAADEYQASDWLQAFIQAAAGVHEGEGVETTPCSLVVTSRHVVTCREQYPSGQAQALSVANIADITAFRAEHSWCVLEFACREVHESSGDWVLYFSSVNEMKKFRACLQELWPHFRQTEFPLNTVMDENVRRRCLETGHVLAQAWEHLVPFSAMK